MQVPFKKIPTFNVETKLWSHTSFESQEQFSEYLNSLFKEPGKYEFDSTTKYWNEQATRFNKKGWYTEHTYGSTEYKEYWDKEKEKCRKGVIWINGNKQWYTERAYYMLINFLPVINKEKGNRKMFPDVRDLQYHLSLYYKRAECQNKHGLGTKKRQALASYFHTAKMINVYWFEADAILRNIASSESYLTGEDGIWNYYNGYRDFLNEHTAWNRPNNPNQDLSWKQQIEKIIDGRKSYVGKKSVLTGKSVATKATAGVGGPAWYVYHEECFSKNTQVLMYDMSSRYIQDIEIGDLVMGYKGSPREVINKCNGVDELYKITQSKGGEYIVNSKHLLILEQNTNSIGYTGDGIKLYTPTDFLNLKSKYKQQVTYGFNSPGLDFEEKSLNIDPYILGCWLGDGTINTSSFTVNLTKDPEILNAIEIYCKNNGFKVNISRKEDKYKDDVPKVTIISDLNKNDIRKKLTLNRIFSDKRIPKEYLQSSRKQRLELLAGLLDTDGNITKNKSYSFYYEIGITKNNLAEDIILLCKSLGFRITHRKKKAKISFIKGRQINTKESNVISIRGNIFEIPVKVKRKKVPKDWIPTSNPLKTRINISNIGQGEYFGITLKADTEEDSWFLLNDFTVVHNCGVAPKLDKTYIFMKPNLESGTSTTGMFFGAGSVGELKDCEPLKKFMESPEENGFLGTENTWFDVDRTPKITGLYIPEQWGMPGFVDEFGNSFVDEALEYLNNKYDKLEKEVDAQDYQYEISQHPRYMKEAFAYREVSKYPVRMIERKQQELKDLEKTDASNKKLPKRVELEEDNSGNIKWKDVDKKDFPYPVDKHADDKSGVFLMHEPPIKDCKYYAGVDTIETGITKTSDSLFSIYIVKGNTEVVTEEVDEQTGETTRSLRIEGIKLVFSWTGRMSEVPDTNEKGIMAMKLYNARTAVERNKPNFINECQRRSLAAKYLLREKELPFTKDLDFSKDFTKDDYGVYMDATGRKQKELDNYVIEFIKEERDAIFKKEKDGQYTDFIKRIYRGVDEINDYWLLEELKQPDSANTDRKRAFGLAIATAKTFEMQGVKNRVFESKSTTKKVVKNFIKPINMLGGYNKPRIIKF